MMLPENPNNTTMEKALARIDNRFDLTLCAAYRARQISHGHTLKTEVVKQHKGKKSTTLALDEIAKGYLGIELLKKAPL